MDGQQGVARRQVSDVVAERIERLIVDGVLKVGQPLPSERRLCEKLGISRSALREGLKVLRGRLAQVPASQPAQVRSARPVVQAIPAASSSSRAGASFDTSAPPVPKPVPKGSTPAKPVSGSYVVQVAALSSQSRAEALARQIDQREAAAELALSEALLLQLGLAQGLRTPDIYSEGTTKVGTAQMGDAVVKALTA